MTLPGYAAVFAGAVLVGLLLWPTGPSRGGGWTPVRIKGTERVPWLTTAVAAGAGVGVLVQTRSVFLAAAAALIGLTCARCFAAHRRATQSTRTSADVARYIGMVANQASVTPTVQETLRSAAPMVTGEVGYYATRFADDCRVLGVPSAGARFAAAVRVPAARWLADLATTTSAGGGAWGDALWRLEKEAANAAAVARFYQRKVAVAFPQMIVTILLGCGMVGALPLLSPDLQDWLYGGLGQVVSLGVAAVVAITVLGVLGQSKRVAQ